MFLLVCFCIDSANLFHCSNLLRLDDGQYFICFCFSSIARGMRVYFARYWECKRTHELVLFYWPAAAAAMYKFNKNLPYKIANSLMSLLNGLRIKWKQKQNKQKTVESLVNVFLLLLIFFIILELFPLIEFYRIEICYLFTCSVSWRVFGLLLAVWQ